MAAWIPLIHEPCNRAARPVALFDAALPKPADRG